MTDLGARTFVRCPGKLPLQHMPLEGTVESSQSIKLIQDTVHTVRLLYCSRDFIAFTLYSLSHGLLQSEVSFKVTYISAPVLRQKCSKS